MGFQRVCAVDDLWEGEMKAFPIGGGKNVLIVNGDGGVLRAFDSICPHQEYPLSEGELDGNVLTCSMHLWQFDIVSGDGVNPTGCRLKTYELKVDGDDILVDVDSLK